MIKDTIDVQTGEVKAATGKVILRSIALGSCVAIVAYDPNMKNGAIAHVMLPGKATTRTKPDEITKYAENITLNNVKLVTILFNRMEIWYNDIDWIDTIFSRIDKILLILNDWFISDDNIEEIILVIEWVDEGYKNYWYILDGIEEWILTECKKIFKDDKIADIIWAFDSEFIPESIGDDNKQLLEIYKHGHNKNKDLSLYDLSIIISNESSISDYLESKKEDEESLNKNDWNIKSLDEQISLELKKLDIEPSFFNNFFSSLILYWDTKISKNKWWEISINWWQFEKEFIIDILKTEWIKDFMLYLDDNNSSINVLWKNIDIKTNIQFIKDILEYKKINKNLNWEKDFWKIIHSYSMDLNSFLEVPKIKDSVFVTFQTNTFMWWDYNWAFSWEKWILREIFKNSEYIDLSITSKEKAQLPDDIIRNLETILKNKPNKEVIFYIWVHWWNDGSASYSGGEIDKKFFTKINDLANKYPNFKAKIDSCYSWSKIDKSNINWNLYYTSENQSGTSEITTVLDNNKNNIDYNKDWKASLKEVVFAEMLDYNDSLLSNSWFHSFVKRKNWNIMNIPRWDNLIFENK